MITKYYNASNNFSAPIIRQPRHRETIVPERVPEQEMPNRPPTPAPHTQEHEHEPRQKEQNNAHLEAARPSGKKGGLLSGLFGGGGSGGILDRFEADDLILLGLLLILISDSDDTLLTMIIGYLFIAGL